jgi:hypothetical protein
VTPEARAARERKQKIFVVVGGLFLLALLAIQLPKLLGGSGDSESTSTLATPVVSPPAQSTAPVPGPSTSASVSFAPSPRETTGKLTSFDVFAPKDPFVQQVVTAGAADAMTETAGGTSAAGPEKAERDLAAQKKFSVGAKNGAADTTTISVNGVRQTVASGATFPPSDPVFVLVAEHPGSRSVEIGVAGGAYSGGSKTANLKLGRPLTLVNTATGARYRLVLISVGSGRASEAEASGE